MMFRYSLYFILMATCVNFNDAHGMKSPLEEDDIRESVSSSSAQLIEAKTPLDKGDSSEDATLSNLIPEMKTLIAEH